MFQTLVSCVIVLLIYFLFLAMSHSQCQKEKKKSKQQVETIKQQSETVSKYLDVYKNQNTLTIEKKEDDGTTSTTVIPLNDSITYTIEKK